MDGSVSRMSKDLLQHMTLDRIPAPQSSIACQNLLRENVSRHGWLRRKRPFHNLPRSNILNPLNSLLSMINWDRKYVVLSKGCMYVFNSEQDKTPERALSLFGYTQILRAGEVRSGKDGGWPFKVAYVLDEKGKVHYFSALREDDMLGWMRAIKRELYVANLLEFSEDCIGDEDYNDLETPISSGNYFQKMKDIEKLKSNIEEDSDLEDNYDYIETDTISRKLSDHETSSISSSLSSSSSLSNVNRKLPAIPTKKEKDERTPVMKKPSPPATAKKTQLPTPPTPPGMKSSVKPQPPPPHPKPTTSPQKLPLPPFPAGVKQRCSGISTTPQESEEATTDECEYVVEEKKATKFEKGGGASVSPSNSDTSSSKKPMPAVPQKKLLLPKTSANTPTAVVTPVRQPTLPKPPKKPSSISQMDLESLALWQGDQGEGQRYLVSLSIEGVYMLRPSTDGSSQSMTLLVMVEDQLRKFKILRNEEGLFSLQTSFSTVFDSIHNLLNHYTNNMLPTRKTRLTQPFSLVSNE